MTKKIRMVGKSKVGHWVDGVAPDSVEGAALLAHSKDGKSERALYELLTGDFCFITGTTGEVVKRRDLVQLIRDKGCPHIDTRAQFKRLESLIIKIMDENRENGYDLLKAASAEGHRGSVAADLFNLYVRESLKASPPDFEAADRMVVQAIAEKVGSMGLKNCERCFKARDSLYKDFRRYVSRTWKRIIKEKNKVA